MHRSVGGEEFGSTGRSGSSMGSLLSTRAGRLAAALLGLLAVAVAIGLVALWPREDVATTAPIVPPRVHSAEVVSVSGEGCEAVAGRGCRLVEVELRDGARSYFTLFGGEPVPDLEPGAAVKVSRNE